jgi:tetratricopeptide (TPR) repeat protein
MKFRFLFIWFLLLLQFAVRGQDYASKQFDYANSLYAGKNYYDAITEYKRLLFFDSTSDYQYTANYKIGECYKAGAKFEDAIKYFTESAKLAKNDDEVFNSKIQMIRTNILRKTTDRAIELCGELEKDERFKPQIDSIIYWRGWAYMFADDWVNASKTFAKINSAHELRKLSQQTDKEKVSVTFAKVISYILPGSGAIYSGKFLSGLMSLGWNALAGYWTVNSFIENRVFDGVVVGELLWLRFYRGAIQNAEEIAVQKNLEVANKSLRYLQNEYKGTKP